MISEIKEISETKSTDIHFALKLLITLASIPLFFSLFFFLLFHLRMIFENTTTLEGLMRRKEGNEI